MTNKNFNQISKYALILSVSYLMQMAFSKYIYISNTEQFSVIERGFRSMIPVLFALVLNAITSLIVYRDIKSNNIKTKYVLLTTLLYRPVGVVAFLLFSIYKNVDDDIIVNKNTENR
jgi:hypothetical protein